MDGIMVVAGLVAALLVVDLVYSVLAVLEWRAQWAGFKVCRNGAVWNVAAGRFATKAEKARLSCLADLIGREAV